jgi:hypothetical protein
MIKKTRGHGDSALSMIFYTSRLEPMSTFFVKSILQPDEPFKSENIMYAALEEILLEPGYNHYDIADQVLLRNIIKNFDLLDDRETAFVNNRASVDFVIYNKQDKKGVLTIEVDGFEYHENNPEQLKRDAIKSSILDKYGIPLLRLPTNGSGEMDKVKSKLDEIESAVVQNGERV